MPKIDIAKIPVEPSVTYPDPFWKPIVGRERKRARQRRGPEPVRRQSHDAQARRLVVAAALASQRGRIHLRAVEGEIVLCEDHSETVLKAGRRRRLEGQQRHRPLPDQPHATGRGLHRSRHAARSTKPWSIPTSTCGSSATRPACAICTRPASPIRRGRRDAMPKIDRSKIPFANNRVLSEGIRAASSPAARSRSSATRWG